jgi:hypothetical protein
VLDRKEIRRKRGTERGGKEERKTTRGRKKNCCEHLREDGKEKEVKDI